jgi:hypothetical protein
MQEFALETYSNIVKQKLLAAKAIYAGMRTEIRRSQYQTLVSGWNLGALLVELKDEIGHGRWLLWLEGNWPALGIRNAQDCMALFRSNENWKYDEFGVFEPEANKFGGFEPESVRKFCHGYYIPPKQQLTFEGDESIHPGVHQLTFVNHFWKYERQLSNGGVEDFSLETFKRDIERMQRRIIELCGWDWISSLRQG